MLNFFQITDRLVKNSDWDRKRLYANEVRKFFLEEKKQKEVSCFQRHVMLVRERMYDFLNTRRALYTWKRRKSRSFSERWSRPVVSSQSKHFILVYTPLRPSVRELLAQSCNSPRSTVVSGERVKHRSPWKVDLRKTFLLRIARGTRNEDTERHYIRVCCWCCCWFSRPVYVRSPQTFPSSIEGCFLRGCLGWRITVHLSRKRPRGEGGSMFIA